MHSFSRGGRLTILLIAGAWLNAEEAAVNPIRLKSGRVPPNQLSAEGIREDAAGFARNAVFDADPGGRFHFLIQFRGMPGAPERAEIERRGGVVVSYVPENAWICALPLGFDAAGLEITYAGVLEAENKLSPFIDPGSPGAVTAVVEFHSDVEPSAARMLVSQAGMELVEHPDLAPASLMVKGEGDGLLRMAALDEVAYILPASEMLRSGEPVAGCLGGNVGGVGAAANLAARFGEGWDGAGLGTARLRYWLGAMAPALDAAAVRSEILRAMEQWRLAAAIEWTPAEGPSKKASVDIAFLQRDHGDGFKFDGRGGVLAHTFYPPPNSEPLAGDIHLDIDEPWRVGLDVDVFSVVLHELGHALGLGHNDDPNSVMYPYYRRVSGLRPADMTEIRKLYAATAGGTTPPGAPPIAPPTTPPAPPAQPPAPPAAPIKDTVAPSLMVSPPPSSTAASAVVLRGMASDNVGVVSVTWQSSAGLSGQAIGLPQFSTSSIPLNIGFNRLTVRARDAAGNESYRTVSITRR